MTRIGFHASHEQISPRQLLADVQHAERAGFQMAMCSDHLFPWSARQGHSGYAWSWLGVALATTVRVGHAVGAGDLPGVRWAAGAGYALARVAQTLSAILLVIHSCALSLRAW